MPGDINSYDPIGDFESFLRATHFNKGVASFGDDVDESKIGRGVASSVVFAWQCVKATANTVTVTPGDIELGPDTVLEWTDEEFTGETTTVTVTAGNATWWIWVNVDISVTPPTAVMYNGATITALSSAEKLTTFQKRIAKITSVDNIITEVKALQCGNITIPRAAG